MNGCECACISWGTLKGGGGGPGGGAKFIPGLVAYIEGCVSSTAGSENGGGYGTPSQYTTSSLSPFAEDAPLPFASGLSGLCQMLGKVVCSSGLLLSSSSSGNACLRGLRCAVTSSGPPLLLLLFASIFLGDGFDEGDDGGGGEPVDTNVLSPDRSPACTCACAWRAAPTAALLLKSCSLDDGCTTPGTAVLASAPSPRMGLSARPGPVVGDAFAVTVPELEDEDEEEVGMSEPVEMRLIVCCCCCAEGDDGGRGTVLLSAASISLVLDANGTDAD